jgi:CMP-N-acetylneuraminic acid synthetase
MIHNKKVLAIVPARGGSKGIPKKNIVKVAGKPLIQYTIEEAKKSKYIDEIHVSTDDLEIAHVVENYGTKIMRLRPKNLALDDSRTIDVILDVVNYYKTLKKSFDIVVLLQPTQPLRKAFHIDEALELFINNNEISVVSVSLVEEHPILVRKINNQGLLEPLLNKNSTVRRQDFEPYYIVNGAIYINKVCELTDNLSLNDNLCPYIMDRKFHIDIDSYNDLRMFELLLKEQLSNE